MPGGFGNIPGGMGSLMKTMQQTMKQMETAKAELAGEKVEASSGGGMVRVVVTGDGAREVVDPDDVQMLEDLVATAVRDAMDKASALREQRIGKLVPGGMGLPPGLF